MTARELIQHLSKYKPDAVVQAWTAEGIAQSITTVEDDHGPDSNVIYVILEEDT